MRIQSKYSQRRSSVTRRNARRRGSAVLEMALMSWPLLFMLLGVSVVGYNLGRNIQVAQIARDAGSMYVRGVDFSVDTNKDLLIRLSNPMNITRTGGQGVIILSKVTFMPASKCTSLSLNPCNSNQYVITQRLVIGNSAARSSAIGTPSAALLDDKGLVTNYMQEPSAIATVPQGLTLVDNEYAYIAEAYFPSPDLDLPGYQTGSGNYSRAMF